jgi:enoyl-CoA hydratase
MALLCDIRLADATVALGLPETRLGMLPAAGGTQTLTRAIGPAEAAPIVIAGPTLDAEEALRLRIIHAIAVDVEADARAVAVALAELDPLVAAAARRALHAAGDHSLDVGLGIERNLAGWARGAVAGT